MQQDYLENMKIMFQNVRAKNVIHPSILDTPAFKLIEEDFSKAVQDWPIYFVIFSGSSSGKEILSKIFLNIQKQVVDALLNKFKWICWPCNKYWSKNEMPMQAHRLIIYNCVLE